MRDAKKRLRRCCRTYLDMVCEKNEGRYTILIPIRFKFSAMAIG